MGRWQAKALAGITTAAALASVGEPLRVAVASNFQSAFASLETGFPGELVATYGSSGLLYAQIVQGRGFDVFLSADADRPRALVDDGRATAPTVYATGRLVLVVNRGEPGARWLSADKRVALANPETAPYGRAALEAMQRLGADAKRINGLNVAQAFHFAASGAADGAFVALAQVVAQDIPPERYWRVPEHLYAPIEQVGVVVAGRNESAARAFLDYLASRSARDLIRQAGYR
ncbi:MAG: molybdate ABC transporter substrate-binding protein [Gammaproteobacteria bacterium]|nr:molybdate ABC transporter substrate-binding protein [Gammaproteobacteria bacterium]MYF29307.1 molybdate ABC transporter substrate-binding protein [Gammaproteobacteria bacterium]MYK46887.1 molybdate ABC transporter substrate-binding protein [Gammaproteobacteria bacterium]